MLRLWPLVLLGIPALATGAIPSGSLTGHGATFGSGERARWRLLTHTSEFVDIRHLTFRSRCEETQPPQALTTPSPLLASWRERRAKVSFIVGTDGRVHSPLILESAGPTGDHHILRTVRSWRYRPATCNGVPTEIEGKVEFSIVEP